MIVVFNILVNIVQANDQKKLKKMVEELANKYGKTEDEIFYAYDQWVVYCSIFFCQALKRYPTLPFVK